MASFRKRATAQRARGGAQRRARANDASVSFDFLAIRVGALAYRVEEGISEPGVEDGQEEDGNVCCRVIARTASGQAVQREEEDEVGEELRGRRSLVQWICALLVSSVAAALPRSRDTEDWRLEEVLVRHAIAKARAVPSAR